MASLVWYLARKVFWSQSETTEFPFRRSLNSLRDDAMLGMPLDFNFNCAGCYDDNKWKKTILSKRHTIVAWLF
jgi:hypothetical protein